MENGFKSLLEEISLLPQSLAGVGDTILSSLTLLNEIPAPTFGEEKRIRILQDRFSESGVQNSSSDEVGNATGVIPGTDGSSNILIVAHADTVFNMEDDHTIFVQKPHVIGRGISDNGLGLAVLASLPILLERLDIQFASNLVLLGDVRSLGRGNLEGLQFFLEHNDEPIRAGISIEGVQLGRLSTHSLGMFRGEIICSVPDEYDWSRFGATGAVFLLNDVINRMMAIPLPRRPRTSIVFGSVRGGTSYNEMATKARLRFEMRSEDEAQVEMIKNRVEMIVEDVASETGADIKLELVASRHQGGIPSDHPLALRTRDTMKALGIEPRIRPSVSELASFIDHDIPAITLGISRGERDDEFRDHVEIDQIPTGVAQLLGVLMAIDRGFCDVD